MATRPFRMGEARPFLPAHRLPACGRNGSRDDPGVARRRSAGSDPWSVHALRTHASTRRLFRHLKAVGAWGTGVQALDTAGIDPEAPGVLTGKKADTKLVAALGMHRAWDRTPLVAASLIPPSV